MVFLSLTLIPASVHQMMKGLLVVITAALSVIFLHRKLVKHHYLGIVITVVGTFLVGYSSSSGTGTFSSKELIGLLIITMGYISYGCHIVIQEALMTRTLKIKIDPLQLGGWEGFWGLVFFTVLLPIFQWTPCSLDAICSNGKIEDSMLAMDELAANPKLICLSIALLINISVNTAVGNMLTKIASGALRCMVD